MSNEIRSCNARKNLSAEKKLTRVIFDIKRERERQRERDREEERKRKREIFKYIK